MTIRIESARQDDLPSILALLRASHLPTEGLSEYWGTTLVARGESDVVGCAALEIYGDAALLRSVAVAASMRGQGLGMRLTESALGLARKNRVASVYLLTETASEFFPRFGFRTIERSQVPSSVQTSLEFTSACPQTALAMTLTL